MDRIAFKKSIADMLNKYRNILLVLLVGIAFMVIPSPQHSEEAVIPVEKPELETLEQALNRVLTQISGAGEVEVLLTQRHGEKTIYQTDEQNAETSLRRETVIITNAAREESGLVQQVNPPVYLGALVLCEGAGDANVRLSIVQAVMSLTGLTSDRITVLKMK